ncbi:unnamed protein product, partial [Meganyctiphanes norvegica]
MNLINVNDDVKDEPGCSECEYKFPLEIDKIEHSAMHQSSNKIIGPDDIAIENDNFVCMQANLKCEKNIEPSTRLSDTPIINHIQAHIPVVKRESCSDEEISTDENYHEREIGENKLKLEHIHIKDELIPYVSTHQINEHGDIHHTKTPKSSLALRLLRIPGLTPLSQSNSQQIHRKKEMHSIHNNGNIFTEVGIMNNENINYMSDMLSSKSELSQTYLDFPKYSQGLSLKKNKALTTSIEVEVDNTGIYIPPGWKRKLYKTPSPCKRFVVYDCIYLTKLGTKIRLKRDACDYLIVNPHADVDVERLNFKLPTYKYWDSGKKKLMFENNSYRNSHTPNIPMNVNMHAPNILENVDYHTSNIP